MKHFFTAFRPLLADFLSTIVFVAIYAVTGSVTVGIALGIATGIGQIGWLLVTGRGVALMQWASLALVIVLGSASLITSDPRFVMIKPSIGAGAIGLVMLRRGWQSRYLPPVVVEHVAPGVLVFWGYAWAALQFTLGVANLVVAFYLGLKTWAWFTATIPLATHLTLFVIQYLHIRLMVRRSVRSQTAEASQAHVTPEVT